MTAPGAVVRGIAAFEWRYATGRLAFAGAALGLALMGLVLSVNGPGTGSALRGGPYAVTYAVGFLGLVSVFAATLLSSATLLRDVEHRSAEVVYSTSVTKGDYLLGRFAGSFLAVASALAAGVLGLAAGGVLLRPSGAPPVPFDPVPYLWSFAVLALPGALFVAAFLFAVSALTRSTPATYVAGVFLYVLYWVVALVAGSPVVAGSAPQPAATASLAALLDPFGLSAFLDQARYWTLAERNARNVALSGPFLWNRLLVVGLSALALTFAHRRFAFRLPAETRRAGEADDSAPQPAARSAAFRPAPVSASAFLPLLVSATRVELRALLRSGPLAALAILWVAGLAIELTQSFRSAELGTALLPTTGLLAAEIVEPLGLLGALFLVYFGVEIAWRERTTRFSEVVDATPAPAAVFLLSKLAALAAVLVSFALLGAGVGIALQLASGYRELELLRWAGLAGFGVVPLVLLGVLVLFLQALVPNRAVGLLAALAAVLFLHLGALGGPDHPLLRYAYVPEPSWSDFSGFGPAVVAATWFTAYWTPFAALLVLLAAGAWRRGTGTGLLPRLRSLPRALGRLGRAAALGSTGLVVAIGGLAFRQTNVVNRYETERDAAAWKAGYERAYGPLARRAQPAVSDLVATVDLFPGERRLRMRGRSRLTNLSGRDVPAVWVVVRRDVRPARLALAGSAAAVVDARFGTHRFDLARPMRPGESLDLEFDLSLERRSPGGNGEEYDLVPNGSYVHGLAVLPTVGYRRGYELVDPEERRRQGLPAREEKGDDSDLLAGESRMTFDVAVTTPEDQRAVAPGVVVASTVAQGRCMTRFRAEKPVSAFFSIASARYAVERVLHRGVVVEVYFHPGHGRNVAWILDAATRALGHCVSRYGPYPFPQLRIAEVPSAALGGAGFAVPGAVFLAEDRSFLIDTAAPGRIDLLTKRVAHEVAHQWWGHQLDPAPGPGATALVETLARHTELRVLKARHGAEALRPVLDRELDRYLSGRTGGDEVPLVDVGRQPYLYYSKGSLAMAALSELAGEEAVDAALRDLLAEAGASGRAPTSRDLLRHLLGAAPAAGRPLVEEWWTRVVLHDLRVASADATRRADGRYRLDVAVEARSVDATDGAERGVPFDAEVEVVVLGAATGESKPSLLYEGRQRLGGATRFSMVVDGRPGEVVVDPRRLLLDRNPSDNERRVPVP